MNARVRAVPTLATTAALALALPAGAPAQGVLPDGSGLDQYVESLPTSDGDRVPGGGDTGGGTGAGARPLPRSVIESLPAGREGRVLKRIASEAAGPAGRSRGRSRLARPDSQSAAAVVARGLLENLWLGATLTALLIMSTLGAMRMLRRRSK